VVLQQRKRQSRGGIRSTGPSDYQRLQELLERSRIRVCCNECRQFASPACRLDRVSPFDRFYPQAPGRPSAAAIGRAGQSLGGLRQLAGSRTSQAQRLEQQSPLGLLDSRLFGLQERGTRVEPCKPGCRSSGQHEGQALGHVAGCTEGSFTAVLGQRPAQHLLRAGNVEEVSEAGVLSNAGQQIGTRSPGKPALVQPGSPGAEPLVEGEPEKLVTELEFGIGRVGG